MSLLNSTLQAVSLSPAVAADGGSGDDAIAPLDCSRARSGSAWLREREALMAEWGTYGISGLVLATADGDV